MPLSLSTNLPCLTFCDRLKLEPLPDIQFPANDDTEEGGDSEQMILEGEKTNMCPRLSQSTQSHKSYFVIHHHPIGLYRDVWIAAIASSRTNLATQTAEICVSFQRRRVCHNANYVLIRKSASR